MNRWVLYALLVICSWFGLLALDQSRQQIGYAKAQAEHTAAALIAKQTARAKEAAWKTQLQKAQDDASQRQTKLAADAAAARSATDRLRNDLAAIRASLPGLTRAALERYANASADVFAECSREYSGLAQTADRITSERQTLIEGWPK